MPAASLTGKVIPFCEVFPDAPPLLEAEVVRADDDVDGLGRRASAACQTAAKRVDSAMSVATDRIATEQPEAPTLKVV